MAATSIPWLYLPIIKSKKNATKWVDANDQDLDLEVDYLPWGWGQPNYHSKQNCTVVRRNQNFGENGSIFVVEIQLNSRAIFSNISDFPWLKGREIKCSPQWKGEISKLP